MIKQYVEKRDRSYWVFSTRVSLDSIVFAFQNGLSAEAIATECFPTLTLEQVYGAITYYLANQSEIDSYLQQVDKESEALRKATIDGDPRFHQQLIQAKRLHTTQR